MHQNQWKLNDGANSFEDWGQRMIDRWNELMAKAQFPWAPNGFLDRVALDQIVVVPDGALPLAGGLSGNNPDSRDKTVDLQWGYPWDPKSVEDGEFYMFRWNGPFYIDFGSIHEMNHARYHIDLYALDENHNANAQNVLIRTDSQNLLPGTVYMPFIAFDVVYYNKWRDIMGAGAPVFDGYSAGAWNWKHHKRGQGNQNAPPDLGRFMNDLPKENVFQFIDQTGAPLKGAEVLYYRATGGTYTKIFDNTPEGSYTTDDLGRVTLPRNPFGGDQPLGGFGPASPIIIFRVKYQTQLYYLFQEMTDFNIQYWMGNTEQAAYIREIDLRDKSVEIPQGRFLGNFFNSEIHSSTPVTVTHNAINFKWDSAPVNGINAENFSVYWHGGMEFTEGWKTFTITSDGGIQLIIDGRLVFDQAQNQSLQTWTPTIYTTASSPFVNPGKAASNGKFHRVEVRYRHRSGPARVQVAWADQVPELGVPINAWRAEYYSTKNLAGYLLSRLENRINYEYKNGSPDPAVGSDNFSARLVGDWQFGAGTYQFTSVSDDGMRIWIDDVQVLNQWRDQSPTTTRFTRSWTTPGIHRIKVEYYEGGSTANAAFSWTQAVVAPKIIQAPKSAVLLEGQTIIFEGKATGYPEPEYQWFRNKEPIAGANTGELVIQQASLEDEGFYYFTVFNSAGSAVSSQASLVVVHSAPVLEGFTFSPHELSFHINAEPGLVLQVWKSEDLRTWTPLSELTSNPDGVDFDAQIDSRQEALFYKVSVKGRASPPAEVP
jgi:hypothetical protein